MSKHPQKNAGRESLQVRGETRVHGVRDIELSYEGRAERIRVRPPNLSEHGMFINTAQVFPEGAVLSLCFSLARTGVEIRTRCEVRHCIPGVGVGVEFIGLPSEAQREIVREIDLETIGVRPITKRGSKPGKTLRRAR